MTKKLFVQAIVKFLAGVVLLGALIFLPAGTLRFPNGWLLMGLLFFPMLCAGIVMMLYAPGLLEKRLNAKERQSEQKEVVWQSGLMFIAAFVLAGLNFRFGWLSLPKWLVWAGAILFLLAYLMWGEVLRENAFLSRTIAVQEGQTVIDSGLYGVVRGLGAAVSVHAARAELDPFVSRDARLSSDHRQAHPRRGETAEKRAPGLRGIHRARKIPPDPVHLVKGQKNSPAAAGEFFCPVKA